MASRSAALALAALAVLLCATLASAQLVIDKAARQIDISGYVVRSRDELTLKNAGAAPVLSFLLCDAQMHQAAFLEVQQEGEKRLLWTEAAPPAGAPEGVACREFTLNAPLAKGASAKVTAVGALTHVLRPEPAEIRQQDAQTVEFVGSAQLMTPYKVASQTTELKAGGGKVHSYTEPAKLAGGRITYGPFTDVAPWSSLPISVHYENNAPFLRVTEVERDVEISHWGAVSIEERYSVRHDGAKIAGEWSRFDLVTKPAKFAQAAAPALGARLPPSAHSLYYRDAIGNISSSATRYAPDSTRVDLIPRYPLFGGWATKYTFGWSQPFGSVVSLDPGTGRMRASFDFGPSFQADTVVVDRLVVKLVLPEGSRDPQVAPYAFPLAAPPTVETHLTYLDVMGRPTVVLEMRNYVLEKGQALQVTYVHSSLGLLQKPLLLVAAIGAIFVAAMALGAAFGSSPSAPALAKPHAA